MEISMRLFLTSYLAGTKGLAERFLSKARPREIVFVPTAANAGYYARIVKDKALMRGLVQAGTRITQLGYSTDAGDIAELVTLAEAEVYSVAHHEGEKEDYVAVSELLGEANLEIEAAQNRDLHLASRDPGLHEYFGVHRAGGLNGGGGIRFRIQPV